MNTMGQIKQCSKCGEVKPVNEFYKCSKHADGLQYKCKPCQRGVMNDHRATDEQREMRLAYNAKTKEHRNKRDKDYYHTVQKSKPGGRYGDEHSRNYHRTRMQRKRKEDIQYAIKDRLAGRIRSICKNGKITRSGRTEELLGCPIDVFLKHLERQFPKGMNWDNRDKWHIDHIIPCASFDLTDPEQQRQCFHYSNLQPLWAEDNIRKLDKILEPVQMKIAI